MHRNKGQPSSRHRAGKVLRAIALLLVGLPMLYLAAALVGSLVPRNSGWQEPRDGILIFVRSNGVHADLVLPARADGIDLYRLMSPGHIVDPNAARGWIALGWGQREFYLETPRWADLSVRNAARAIFGGDALMHVVHVARPRPSGAVRPLRLERQAYRTLVAAVADGFATGDDGQPVPLLRMGYANDDIFYEATGRYNAFRTSNQWTSDALADAGVTIGLWTPFAQGIMWRFRSGDAIMAVNETAL